MILQYCIFSIIQGSNLFLTAHLKLKELISTSNLADFHFLKVSGRFEKI